MYTAVLMLAMTTGADSADFGRRGGCSGCSGYYGGCCSGGYYGGCCGGGYYRTGYMGNYYGPGYMNGTRYVYGTGYSSGPIAYVPNGTQVRQSFYQGPNQNTAMVQVLLPNPDAEVWFDNASTTQRGIERFYQSPALETGANYNYTIKARWMEDGRKVEQERRVDIRPGQPVMVDFRAKAGEKLSNPNPPNPKQENPIKKNETQKNKTDQ